MEFVKFPVETVKVPIGNIPNWKSHLMLSPKFPIESLKVSIGKILMIPNFVIQTLKVPIRKTQRLMGDPNQELINKLMLTRRILVKDILFIGNFMNWILGCDTFSHWYYQ